MYSTTQASNIAAMASVIVLIAKTVFNKEVAAEDITTVISSIIAVVAIMANYVNRYKKGDVTVAGFKK